MSGGEGVQQTDESRAERRHGACHLAGNAATDRDQLHQWLGPALRRGITDSLQPADGGVPLPRVSKSMSSKRHRLLARAKKKRALAKRRVTGEEGAAFLTSDAVPAVFEFFARYVQSAGIRG
jgi:hypothetical protein